MDKEYLKNKIEGLRHHFVESTIHERAIGFYDEAHMTKKMLKIKRNGYACDGTVPKED